MIRKLTSLTLVFMFLFTTLVSAQAAAESTVVGKLGAVEKELYGTEQTGALLDRTTKLNKELFGADTKEVMINKVDALYDHIYDNASGSASMLMKTNAVEWTVTQELTYAPIKERIEKMETLIEGKNQTGSYESRLHSLASLAFANGMIGISNKVVPANQLIKINIVSPIDAKTARVGDVVKFQAADNVIMDGVLVIAKGCKGEGTIKKVSQAQNFGRDAKIEIDFSYIQGIDGNKIPTFLGEEAKKQTESLAIAAGATVAGLAILGPVGIVGGAFVKGKNLVIPEGSQMYIQTKAESVVYGFQAVGM